MKLEKRNIRVVAGMHGNERMPVQALCDAGIEFLLANPRAYKRNVRFTEQDLNASFGTRQVKYESRRASEILKQIGRDELVIDFHTSAEKIPFVVLVDRKMIPLAEWTGVRRVVFMKHNIKKGRALINYRDGISIEAGAHADAVSMKNTVRILRAVSKRVRRAVVVYEVYGEIREPGKYTNFKLHADGFIPVLANEPEYQRRGLFGLKARIVA